VSLNGTDSFLATADQLRDTIRSSGFELVEEGQRERLGESMVRGPRAPHRGRRNPDHPPRAPDRQTDSVAPSEAIGGFLDALGVPLSMAPAGLAARAARYRSLLASKRVLVVLDNARDAEQVRPLLPGGATCLVGDQP
jgi:hypothetical protein